MVMINMSHVDTYAAAAARQDQECRRFGCNRQTERAGRGICECTSRLPPVSDFYCALANEDVMQTLETTSVTIDDD